MRGSMSENGVELYGICSEPDDLAKKTMKDWGVSVPLIGDPTNAVSKGVITNELLPTLRIVTHDEQPMHPKIGSKKTYPHGCVQPGVLFITLHEAPAKPTTLFAWAVKPSLGTMGGASKRVDIVEVWERVQQRIASGTAETDESRNLLHDDVRTLTAFELFCCTCCYGCCGKKK
eukprot:TRINITY_DN71_c1_g3_i1.p1 TRINITY_DN71_c1_g3~~TRINITY_DN71_c1_g3_i1.p1  ORF type:complete len:174 (+),score=73.06 TRINITY_DN71_c1_g3_i1:176-697(+)